MSAFIILLFITLSTGFPPSLRHVFEAVEDEGSFFSIQEDALVLEAPDNMTSRSLYQSGCGIGGPGDRIIGGFPVPEGSYPWVVSLQLGWSYHYCGGALISPYYVLTAAHCVSWGREVLSTKIKLGGSRYGLTRRVHKIKIHAGYNEKTNDKDIALIKLRRPVSLGGNINTICLPQEKTVWGERQAVVAGWGHTSFSGSDSHVLQDVEVNLISQEQCKQMYSDEEITDNMLCAGTEEGGKDACQGDSGGALFVKEAGGRWVAPGIVSWGRGCGDKDHPGVYTRIQNFLGWIERHSQI